MNIFITIKSYSYLYLLFHWRPDFCKIPTKKSIMMAVDILYTILYFTSRMTSTCKQKSHSAHEFCLRCQLSPTSGSSSSAPLLQQTPILKMWSCLGSREWSISWIFFSTEQREIKDSLAISKNFFTTLVADPYDKLQKPPATRINLFICLTQ